ncbi:MAG: tetratricopeptide repeat protein [Candidatus Omnitrophica bacterium]|nr:tetratricopeptide repeat protein [Candidatus Omnitrophota bacterium]
MNSEDRRLAAIMFTDIVGYSALSQRNEALSLSLLAEHREILEPIFDQYNGVVIKSTGDGYLAEFASAIQAVQCAVAMQTAVYDRNRSADPDRVFQIRIGLHVGDIVHQDGDVLGDGVNIASRIEPLAEPGGICISEQVYDHVHNKVELHLVNLGPQELKNISIPLEIYRVFLPWEDVTAFKPRLIKSRCPKEKPLPAKIAILLLPLVAILAAFGGYHYALKGNNETSQIEETLKTVAVLPFRNLSEGNETGYFSEGITEELINALSKLEGIRVPARTSAFAYQNSDKDPTEIAKELGVEAILEGSVRTDGDQFRISAVLSDIQSGYVLWSEIFDRKMENIFEVQDEITKTIVKTLKGSLHIEDDESIVVASTKDSEAYQCYLKGRDAWNDRTEEGFKKALQCFQNAVNHDPNYANAYAGLADTYHLMERYGHIPTEQGRAKAKENALKALELNPDLAAARTSLATIYEYEWDWENSEMEFRRAIELEPHSVLPRQWYASLLGKMGRFDEALEQLETALPLDPISPPLNRSYGFLLMAAGKDDQALTQLRKTLEMSPDFPGVRLSLATQLAIHGATEEARELIQQELDKFGDSEELQYNLAFVDKIDGNMETTDRLITRFDHSIHPEDNAFSLAMAYTLKGDFDQAFEWLNAAVDRREFEVTHLRTLRVFDPLRKDPRYDAVLRRMKLDSSSETRTKT